MLREQRGLLASGDKQIGDDYIRWKQFQLLRYVKSAAYRLYNLLGCGNERRQTVEELNLFLN